MNYNHIPVSGYNMSTDLEYLKYHNDNDRIISIIIKQNKKSQLDKYNYDFNRVINVTGHNDLVNTLVNDSTDEFNTFLIDYFQ